MGPIAAVLRRAGAASPMVPALVYTATLAAANLAIGLAPGNVAVAAGALLAWALAALFLGVVVTWYRDDDWLAAGMVVGLTVLVGALAADAVASTLLTGSIGHAVFTAAGASLGLLVRAVVLVPVSGGAVALARWATARLRRPRRAAAPPA
jgi:hypothetical protein